MSSTTVPTISIVIPTYEREQVLLDTVAYLLELQPPADEIILVDQTQQHESETELKLAQWNEQNVIHWLRLVRPSIPNAMNQGLLKASSELVLFLDDDLIPSSGLVVEHRKHYADPDLYAVVGQVLQPGQNPCQCQLETLYKKGLKQDLNFAFNAMEPCRVKNCMAGNLSVRRHLAIQAGGMDENFLGVAYRFETEFCRRLIREGGHVLFNPDASIRHLQAPQGGTRSLGYPLLSASPLHGVGDYYFALREGGSMLEIVNYFLQRLFVTLSRGAYLRKPWWLPIKFVGECRAMMLALRLQKHPRLLSRQETNLL